MATRHSVRGTAVPSQPVVHAEPQIVEETVVEPAPVVAQAPVVAAPVVESHRVVRRGWSRYSASQLIHGACGLFLVIIGAIAVGRAGFDDVGEGTVEVLGITTTALIGLVLLLAGLLLLCAALAPEARGFGGFIGVLLLVGGIIIAAGSDELLADLHTEAALGWLGIIVGAVAILGAVLPAFLVDRRSTTVDVW
jgi:hypothetical protein